MGRAGERLAQRAAHRSRTIVGWVGVRATEHQAQGVAGIDVHTSGGTPGYIAHAQKTTLPLPPVVPPTIYYGLTSDRPLSFPGPSVEALPDQPLPDCAPFLRVCAGVDEPSTVMLRGARELVGVWRHVHDERPQDMAKVNEQLNLNIRFIDCEAGGHQRRCIPTRYADVSINLRRMGGVVGLEVPPVCAQTERPQ